MKSCYDELEGALKNFKKKHNIELNVSEINLLKVIIANFLADINYRKSHEEGEDVSDYIEENIEAIEQIYKKLSNI